MLTTTTLASRRLIAGQSLRNTVGGASFFGAAWNRQFLSTNSKKSFQSASVNIAPDASKTKIPVPHKLQYLETLSNQQLLSYGVIALCTLNKPILNFVIKLFPYTPMFLIKAFVSNIYCGGETIQEVMNTGEKLSERGIQNMMINLSIEACDAKKNIDISYIVNETVRSINEIAFPHTVKMIERDISKMNEVPPCYVALKPTGLVDNAAEVLRNYQNPKYSAQFETLVANCSKICEVITKKNEELARVYPNRLSPLVVATIDAEAYQLQQGVYELQRRLYQEFNPKGRPVSVVGTVQMYLKDSKDILSFDKSFAEKNNCRLGLKLVRGAYIHSEPNRGVIHDTKHDTDVCYDEGISNSIDDILSIENNMSTIGHLIVASHNSESQYKATSKLEASLNPAKSNVVLAQLLGMADDVTFDLIKNHNVHNIIKYVPWGPPKETKEYLYRRLEENGDAVRSDNGWPLFKGVVRAFYSRVIS